MALRTSLVSSSPGPTASPFAQPTCAGSHRREIVAADRSAFRSQHRQEVDLTPLPNGGEINDSETGRTWTTNGPDLLLATPVPVSKDGRRVWSDDHYQEIAALHREAGSPEVARSDSHNYIREQWNARHPDRPPATKTTVKNWVRACRVKGML